jgi:heat shock protein HtpX
VELLSMMDIYQEQSKNNFRTWFLMTIFLVVIIAIGWVFAQAYNSPVLLYGAIIFSLVMNFFSYWYSDKIVLSMYRAQPIQESDNPTLWDTVENLAITAGLPMPKVYIIPDPAPNAFATGRNKDHAAVAVTSGLLQMMSKTELEGVIAHELSHVGNKDILLSTIVVVLVGFVSLISHWFLRANMFGGMRSNNKEGNSNAIFMVIGVVLAILSPIAVTLIQLAISRKREYLADASGALLTRYPEGLASALEKIGNYTGQLQNANNTTAHLFISNPFGKNKLAGLFATHPAITDRIRILRGIE